MIDIKKIQKEKPIQELLNFSLINIDKPTGPTSFEVSQFVKKALNLAKTSHMGTLDPHVSGVLPITLGRACRLSEYFMHRDKTYIGIMRLHEEIFLEQLKKEMSSFLGKIKQLPPVRSRVKRQLREREIKEFEIIEKEGKDVLFISEVEAGTHIRKLCSDLGEKIGGAHMLELRRIKAGLFDESNLINLYELDSRIEKFKMGDELPLREILIPAEILTTIIPVVQIKESSVKQLLTGKPIHVKDTKGKLVKLEKGDKILVFHGERFIQAAQVVNEGDILAKPDFVLN